MLTQSARQKLDDSSQANGDLSQIYGTARELTRLARVALDKQVKLVVDNLQSGPETGLEFAKSVGAAHVTLTSFPSEAGYAAAVTANADSLLAHLK